VTGAAAIFRDWYITRYGTAIDDPGLLYTNLLLMGDGLTEATFDPPFPWGNGNGLQETYSYDGFDGLLGAGRMRLRAFDNAGLDNPWGYRTGSGCLGQLASHTLSINGGAPLPAGVDYIKATTWWYDRDHDDVQGLGHKGNDQYRLELERWDSSSSSWDVVATDDSADNKQRVFFTGDGLSSGGDIFQLRITGMVVDSGLEGCGTNANRVYYALMYEDNARNDGNALDVYVRPHPEVQ
jgi:hypothetical protein